MSAFRQKRLWFWIAIAAIVVVLVALLVPHGHSTPHPDWLALLPLVFIGMIAPLSLVPFRRVLSCGHSPQAPVLAPSFQRPPPFRLA
jgi:hypothetical protein